MPAQFYDAPSRKVGKIFVGIVSVELDRVSARKWNLDRVVVFQSVIIQRVQGANNSAQIRKCILFRLDFWNRGAFDELMKVTYNLAVGYLVKARGIQKEVQHHQRLWNLKLKVKLREAVQLVCDW